MSVSDSTCAVVAHVEATSADGKAWIVSGHDKRTPQHVLRLEFVVDPFAPDQVLIFRRPFVDMAELPADWDIRCDRVIVSKSQYDHNGRQLHPKDGAEVITMNQIIIWFWTHVHPSAQAGAIEAAAELGEALALVGADELPEDAGAADEAVDKRAERDDAHIARRCGRIGRLVNP